MKTALAILLSLAVVLTLGILLLGPVADQPAVQTRGQKSPGGTTMGTATGTSGGPTVWVSEPVVPSLSVAVHDLPLHTPAFTLDREINPRLNLRADLIARGTNGIAGGLDPLLALQESAAPVTLDAAFHNPALNLNGMGYTYVNPPDTEGEVGLDHYIQMINGSDGAIFSVHNKSDGSVLGGPFDLDALGITTVHCQDGYGDGIVLYDRLADRWLLSEFASAGNHLCVYISETPDPLGAYYAYDFETPTFPDYPKYAVWPDAYYVSTNESNVAAYALERSQMLIGGPATFQRLTIPDLAGFGFQALTPSDLDGPTPPPANSPNYLIRHRDDEVHNPDANNPTEDYLEIWEYDVDFAIPTNTVISGPTNIAIAEFDSDLCGLTSYTCFPMPGTATQLDPLREVVMWRLQYRNFGTHETLVGNLVTDVDGTDHGGIRWFELRKIGSGPWTLYQEGTYAPDADHRWMGSIAMDRDGNIALGYSVSSTTTYPSVRYAGRRASNPLGTLPHPEVSLIEGTGSNSSNRWGDYSSMRVDPADDCTFWFTNMYSPGPLWATRIAAFKFATCGLDLPIKSYLPLVIKES